ncbi:MAG: hypothetical protein QXR45_13955 [Candidatus Bathyarchaeia archaeon]
MKNIALVTGSKANIENYVFGQEYYLHKLREVLEEEGYRVELMEYKNFLKSTVATKLKPDVAHLYYLNSTQLATLKTLLPETFFVYHVYHVKDDTWNPLHTLSWKMFLISAQLFVNCYLATSLSVNRWLRQRIFASNVALVEPLYECTCNAPRSHEVFFEKFGDPDEVRLLYLGRLHTLRFSLNKTIESLRRVSSKRKIKLIIATLSRNIDFSEKRLKMNDIELEIINRRLSEKEKCTLYRWAQFFLYPARGNVAMNPPITLLEASYHGALPIVTSHVLNDLDIPSELAINNISELSLKIEKLLADPDEVPSLYTKLFESLKRFFDRKRFLDELRCSSLV